MSDDRTQNSHGNVDINPYVVTQREIEEMGNFVASYPFPDIPDPEPNNDIGLSLSLGLGLDQPDPQQLDDQGNAAPVGVDAAEPTSNPMNSSRLLRVEGQDPDLTLHSGDHGSISATQGRAMDLIMSVALASDLYDTMISDKAEFAMKQLVRLATQEESDPSNETPDQRLNKAAEYEVPLQLETSREIAFVGINRIGLIELLMDPTTVSTQFPDIVARSSVIREIQPGTAYYDGALQVMKIEFHMPTPLASTRESYFLRYSKKLSADTWGVVDLSLESLFPTCPGVRYQRKWSGCTIQELPISHTKVTWVENVEVDNSRVHSMLQGIVGFEFGSKRWISALARQRDWMNCPAFRFDYKGKSATPEGARYLLILVEKMMVKFFTNASASQSKNNWMPLTVNGAEDIKVALKPYSGNNPETLPSDDEQRTMVIATTAPIPVFQKKLFEFLSDPQSRPKWDMLSMRHTVKERVRINIGNEKNTENHVSVLQFVNEGAAESSTMTFLQRAHTDSTCSFVIYAPVDVPTMSMLLDGTGDPNKVELLPSGFVVFPDSGSMNGEDTDTGSLLSVVFEVMDQTKEARGGPTLSPKSAETVHNIVDETVSLIKDSVVRGTRRCREDGSDD